jgi:hypothetical protein
VGIATKSLRKQADPRGCSPMRDLLRLAANAGTSTDDCGNPQIDLRDTAKFTRGVAARDCREARVQAPSWL